MKAKLFVIVALLLFISCNSQRNSQVRNLALLSYSNDTISALHFGLKPNSRVLVTNDWDLQGLTLSMPDNVELVANGGVISNGCIVGCRTIIEGEETIFDRVHVQGSWVVPIIKTSMFADLNYDNSLKDVFALTNPKINNKVFIEKGEYQVSLSKNADVCLNVISNTEVIVDGIVRLKPNDFPNYSIITIAGDNIVLKGRGSVVGDKTSHLGNTGEWGMCLSIRGNNIKVKDLSFQDAWGDCIYVTANSQNVDIMNCELSNGRRQGISVISGNKIHINRCLITDVGGTDPEYAIDVEPNQNDEVGSVFIERVVTRRCKGGFTAHGRSKGSRVNKIIVRNCDFEAVGKPVVIATKIDTIEVRNCCIRQKEGQKVIAFDHITNLNVERNRVHYDKNSGAVILNNVKTAIGIPAWPMIIDECTNTEIKRNRGL